MNIIIIIKTCDDSNDILLKLIIYAITCKEDTSIVPDMKKEDTTIVSDMNFSYYTYHNHYCIIMIIIIIKTYDN